MIVSPGRAGDLSVMTVPSAWKERRLQELAQLVSQDKSHEVSTCALSVFCVKGKLRPALPSTSSTSSLTGWSLNGTCTLSDVSRQAGLT